jgi:hypothetical protein
MKSRHGKFTTTLDGSDADVEVEYTYTPGSPATGPTYACGGVPGDDAEAEITRIVGADGNGIDFDSLPELVQDTLRYEAIFEAEDGADRDRAMAEDAYEARRMGES